MGVHKSGPPLIALILSLALVGCLSAAPAEWGTGQGMVSVEMSDDDTSVTIHKRLSSDSNNDIVAVEAPIIGCNTNENGTIPAKSRDVTAADHGGDPIRIEGWLATSKIFPDDDGPSIEAIIVDVMPIEDAEDIKGIDRNPATEVPGIQDKRWATPLYAEAQFGQDYESVEQKRGWALIGIIPANENVLDGMAGLQEWNRPIALEGYILHGSDGGLRNIPSWETSVQNCELSSNTRFAAHMVITTIEIGGVTASESESYSMGSIPIIGGPLYLMIVLIGGGAGAFGTFTYASIQIRTAASKQAAMLMSEKQIKAAGGVVKELKKHKKEVESINKDRKKSESIAVVDDTGVKKVEIKEFDVSATLEGAGAVMEALDSVSHNPNVGVIQTEASVEMDDKLREVMEAAMAESSSPSSGPSGRRKGGGVTGGGLGNRRTMSSSIASEEAVTESEPEPVSRRPPVKRKRAVRTPKENISEPEPEPKPKIDTRDGPSISDDDEFSDFSF